jgi:hypothetical protein
MSLQPATSAPCNIFGQLEAIDESLCRSLDRLATIANRLGVTHHGPEIATTAPVPEPNHILPFTEWMYSHVTQLSTLINGITDVIGEKGLPASPDRKV